MKAWRLTLLSLSKVSWNLSGCKWSTFQAPASPQSCGSSLITRPTWAHAALVLRAESHVLSHQYLPKLQDTTTLLYSATVMKPSFCAVARRERRPLRCQQDLLMLTRLDQKEQRACTFIGLQKWTQGSSGLTGALYRMWKRGDRPGEVMPLAKVIQLAEPGRNPGRLTNCFLNRPPVECSFHFRTPPPHYCCCPGSALF